MSKIQQIYNLTPKNAWRLYHKHGSIASALEHLNINSRDPRCRRVFSAKIKEFTGNNDHSTKHSRKADLSVPYVSALAKQCSSITQLLKALKLQQVGSNFSRVRKFINENNIIFGKDPTYSRKYTDDEVYRKNSPYSRTNISNRVIKDGWLPMVCRICGQEPTWNGQPLRLQLDHENGNCTDNTKDNLRWLCPNCHSQTVTHSGKMGSRVVRALYGVMLDHERKLAGKAGLEPATNSLTASRSTN